MTRPLSNLNLALNRAQSGAAFSPDNNSNLSFWIDAQDRTGWTMSSDDVATAINKAGSGSLDCPVSQRPTIVQVNSLDMMQSEGDDFMLEGSGALGPMHPGSGDFTVVAVFRSTNANRGLIAWKNDASVGGGQRWLLRIANGGSDMEWSIDDDTAAQTLVADDVDFANDDIYVVIATRRGDTLEFFYGNGGALSEATNSPFSLPGGYGTVGEGQATFLSETQVSPSQTLDGELGEFLFYNGEAIDAAERDQLYSYLVSKWDL